MFFKGNLNFTNRLSSLAAILFWIRPYEDELLEKGVLLNSAHGYKSSFELNHSIGDLIFNGSVPLKSISMDN